MLFPFIDAIFLAMAEEPKYTKTIVCLANSRKLSGRCLAGKELTGGKTGVWIRPVSARPHEEISEEERRYHDGHSPSLLETIAIPFMAPKAHTFQSENHLIDPGYYWQKTGDATWAQVEGALDNVQGALWINGHSTYHGENDQVPDAEAAKLTNSLLLVRPTNLRITVGEEGGVFGPAKRKARANFTLNQAHYSLSLTDAEMERKYLQGQNGTFPVANAILCVSLGEPYKGHAYKLAAALITQDRVKKNG